MSTALLSFPREPHDGYRIAAWLAASLLLHGLLLSAFGTFTGTGAGGSDSAMPAIDVVLGGTPARTSAGGLAGSPPRRSRPQQVHPAPAETPRPAPAPRINRQAAQTRESRLPETQPHAVAAHRALPAHAPRTHMRTPVMTATVARALPHAPRALKPPARAHKPVPRLLARQRVYTHVHVTQAAPAPPPPAQHAAHTGIPPVRSNKPAVQPVPRQRVYTRARKTREVTAPSTQRAPKHDTPATQAPASARTVTHAPAAPRPPGHESGTQATRDSATAPGTSGQMPASPEVAGAAQAATIGATTGGSGAAGRGDLRSLATLASLLHAAIAAHQHYPAMARRLGREGVATVRFNLHPDGVLDGIVLDRSSGFAALDKAALLAVAGVAPFTPAARYLDGVRQFTVQVVFRLF